MSDKPTDEQAKATPNTERPTWDLVHELASGWQMMLRDTALFNPNFDAAITSALDDMHERDAIGVRKYGTRLQPNNGRDPLVDLYQELLDGAVYAANDAIEQGMDPARSAPAYCKGPGGLVLIFGCTYAHDDVAPSMTQQISLARFWKTLDLAIEVRMEIAQRAKDAATTS